MPADNEPLVSLEELSSLLHRHEGPDRPTRKQATARSLVLRRSSIVAVAALLLGSGLGFGAASWLTPSGKAASTRVGMGFVADSGWTVLQSNADAVPERPAFAIAANVPLHPEDDARGIQNTSGLPYATLLGLPPRGIVIVATFSIPQDTPWRRENVPKRTLPLRLRDATRFAENATQLRPDRPLGEYRLRARVNGRDIELHFYFGRQQPTKAMVVAAQRQLDRLVVQPTPRATAKVEQRALPLPPAAAPTVAAASRIADRTFVCTPGVNAIPVMTVDAASGFRAGERLERMGQLSIYTRGDPRPRRTQDYLPTMVGLTAGWPPPRRISSGGVGVDLELCKSTRASIPFTKRGLKGGAAGRYGDEYDCLPPAKVLIRFRVVFHSPATLKPDANRTWLGAIARIDKGQLAVVTPKGKPLVYGEVFDSGKTSVFTEPNTCFYDP